MAEPLPLTTIGGSVSVSGISCRLPESDNMEELRQNLLNSKDMVTDYRRWDPGVYGLPKRCGTLKDISKFDAIFFGVNPKQADRMDPQLRILLEVVYEAIVDAGVNPDEVRGSKTGVFVGSIGSEAHIAWSANKDTIDPYTMTGCAGAMLANRLSFFFDFKGPSVVLDTACSSSLTALNEAFRSIRTGDCDSAIVAGANLILKPSTSMEFQKLGMLSPEGMCKSFDEEGNGYCRSEGIVAIYLQKTSQAKRTYCTILHCKSNADGYKEEGVTFPSRHMQKQLIREVCEEAGVSGTDIVYMEAHGTGTRAGDPQEAGAFADLLCDGRKEPLLIGSIKSNLGHTEPVSGLAALAKVVIAMEVGYIPANLHYNTPNPDIPALQDYRLKVVTETTKLPQGIVGLISFGFGGSNTFALLVPAVPPREQSLLEQRHPRRLFTCSWRTEEGLNNILDAAVENSTNVDYLNLLQMTSQLSTCHHPHRGYAVLNSENEYRGSQECSEDRPVWYVFTGMGSQWPSMGRAMMELEPFRASIQRSDACLQTFGINLYQTIMGGDEKAFAGVMSAFVGIVAIQIALVDMLSDMGMSSDGIIGHSLGELSCAYADGAMTSDETLLTAYWRGRCVEEANLPPGAMAAVGMTWEELTSWCPSGVVPACNNSQTIVTVSGDEKAVSRFVKEVSNRGIFCKAINSAGVAFHSHHMVQVAPRLRSTLANIVPKVTRSPRWISTSIPESMLASDLAKFSSADYYVNNLVSPVFFHEAVQKIPKDAILIEIAPDCLFHGLLKRSLGPSCLNVGLMRKGHKNNADYLLSSLGKCFVNGMKVDTQCLRAAATFPVSKGTPMISPLLKWDHSHTWSIPEEEDFEKKTKVQGTMEFNVDSSSSTPLHHLKDHVVDDLSIIPATAYLVFAWQTLAEMLGETYETMAVVFKDVEIHRASSFPSRGSTKFSVRIMGGGGYFEIFEHETLAVSGHISIKIDQQECRFEPVGPSEATYELNADDVYKEFRLRGHDFGPRFRQILRTSTSGESGEVLWTGDWITYLDALLQMYLFSSPDATINLITRLTYVAIQPGTHLKGIHRRADGREVTDVMVDRKARIVRSAGVMFLHPYTVLTQRRLPPEPIVSVQHFVPYVRNADLAKSDSLLHYKEACSVMSLVALKKWVTKNNGSLKEEIDQLAAENFSTNTELIELNYSVEKNCEMLRLVTDYYRQRDMGTKFNFLEGACLQDDRLLTSLHGPEALKPILDIVMNNLSEFEATVFELQTSTGAMYRKVKPLMDLQPNFAVNYKASDSSLSSLDMEELASLEVEAVEWDFSQPLPESLQSSQLVLATNLLHKYDDISDYLGKISSVMAEGAFLLVQEVTQNFHIHLPVNLFNGHTPDEQNYKDKTWAMYCDEERWRKKFEEKYFEVISQVSDNLLSTLFLLRKRKDSSLECQIKFNINDFDYDWVDLLKSKVEHITNQADESKLWLISEKTPTSGIVGLINCLRLEPGGNKIRCVFNASLDDGDTFRSEVDSEMFRALVKKDIVMNMYREGVNGSFSHVPIASLAEIQTQCRHAYVNLLKKGDLSSLRWFESPLGYAGTGRNKELCMVHYASLNFRDVMLATGKLSLDSLPGNLASQECILGMEFSGVDKSGKNIAGIVEAQALATSVGVNRRFLFEIPDHWSMAEAATVPVAYSTAYYSLVFRGNIRRGDVVLIHAGSGAVGQAAITLALHFECEVFTTVGSIEKKEFLLASFPQLKSDHIGNSRKTDFETQIMEKTDGRGVDIVLNSLADDKLQASLRVLAEHGRFLEIGKYDMTKNTSLGMAMFLKNVSFHGILLDSLFGEFNRDWETVAALVKDGIDSGVVRPLKNTIFRKHELEKAFRLMLRGQHIGKVLIEVVETSHAGSFGCPEIRVVPRTYFYPEKCYVVTGGLGGFGLELVGWMVSRGARKLILTSRSGIVNGYQQKKLDKLRNNGANVVISSRNAIDTDDSNHLISEATELGPVGGVFHLAGVLSDGILKNQTKEKYEKVCHPKVKGIMNLDRVTSNQCRDSLDWFVAFSSHVAGYGNSGQCNYGFANSVMERVCEDRQSRGLPGLAIQWGVVGDTGMAMVGMDSHEFQIAGTRPQRMFSCLSELDRILHQPHPVVSCFVKADVSRKKRRIAKKKDVVETLLNILGIKEKKSISPHSKFAELGVDSLLGIEVTQTLENDFGLILSLEEFRHMMLSELDELLKEK